MARRPPTVSGDPQGCYPADGEASDCLRNDLLPNLREAGIHILAYPELNARQKAHVKKYFGNVVFPVLTPLALDPGRPFPHISNLSLNLAVLIRDPQGRERFARVKVPGTLPRLVPLTRSSGGRRTDGTVLHPQYFAWLEQVIAAHVDALFPGVGGVRPSA
jgi:polyphosphate kinase